MINLVLASETMFKLGVLDFHCCACTNVCRCELLAGCFDSEETKAGSCKCCNTHLLVGEVIYVCHIRQSKWQNSSWLGFHLSEICISLVNITCTCVHWTYIDVY